MSDWHRLSYVSELSQLFHFDLNASAMVLKTYLGTETALLNASSLSRHKDQLHRTFDVNKAPYSDAKSLIQTSLFARLLDCVM